MNSTIPEAARQRLLTLYGERFSENAHVREQHSHGESHHAPAWPDAVVFVEREDELQETARICARHRIPIIAFGAGTCIEGQVQALYGGLCIDFTRMNRIIEVNAADLDCVVEPGVTREQLNQHLRDKGLFFPVDPGANATLGGMLGTGASGTTTVRYGGMKHNVLAVDAILADGRKITTGTAARKSSAGFNLTELLIGSEGTLALTSRLRLKLHGIPEAIVAARAVFPSVDDAVHAVTAILQTGIPIARIELLDPFALRAVNRYCQTQYAEMPTLFLEFHGSHAAAEEQVRQAQALCEAQHGEHFAFAAQQEDKNRMWHARHNAYYAALAQVPEGRGWVTDVCVPLSRLAQCIEETQTDLLHAGLEIPIVGHVGDGNFHLLFSIRDDDSAMIQTAQRIHQRLIDRARHLGGTCTGEHGIGLGKMAALRKEKGDATVSAMKAIKQAWDPHNLMNPGKLF